MKYSLAQFENDIKAIRPRPFDIYILPGFLCAYAVKSKGMPIAARRILFVSGVYAGYRNYSQYKNLIRRLGRNIPLDIAQGNSIDKAVSNGE